LRAERKIVEQQRQRTEAAEQQANRAAEHTEHLSTELSTARGHLERWQIQAGEQRAPRPTPTKPTARSG
jgi:DNA-binding protein H-NS